MTAGSVETEDAGKKHATAGSAKGFGLRMIGSKPTTRGCDRAGVEGVEALVVTVAATRSKQTGDGMATDWPWLPAGRKMRC